MITKQFTNNLIEACDVKMKHYVVKRVFTSMPKKEIKKNNITYYIKWHMNRIFTLKIDTQIKKITMGPILPNVNKNSKMDKDFRKFIWSFIGSSAENHKRLSLTKKGVRIVNHNGNLSFSVVCDDDNYCNLLEKIIAITHQVYTLFLRNGGYDEYLVDTFDIDLDSYF